MVWRLLGAKEQSRWLCEHCPVREFACVMSLSYSLSILERVLWFFGGKAP